MSNLPTESPGHRRTAAARAARTRRKLERYADELRSHGWSIAAPGTVSDQTMIALRNFAWLVEHRNGYIDFSSGTVAHEGGGYELAELINKGDTPATRYAETPA